MSLGMEQENVQVLKSLLTGAVVINSSQNDNKSVQDIQKNNDSSIQGNYQYFVISTYTI